MRTDETNDDPPAGIRPLTHRTGDGTVYRRPAAIEEQIVGGGPACLNVHVPSIPSPAVQA